MKRKSYTKTEERLIEQCVLHNMTAQQIADILQRSVGSVDNKIRRLGLVQPSKVHDFEMRKKLYEVSLSRKLMIQEEKARKKRIEDEFIKSMSPCLSDRWQAAIHYTKAKLIDFNGDKVYSINGEPVTIFRIMEIYNSSL